MFQSQELHENYKTAKKKRDSLLEQIVLSKSLIEVQEKEILVDRIAFIDMVKSLFELVQTYVSFLNNDIQLYSSIVYYKKLSSGKFQQDVFAK